MNNITLLPMTIKLNLGSGQRPFGEGWWNVDSREQGYPVDIITDVKNLSIFPDNSVDVIVAHHLFEHIRLDDQDSCLQEWYRVLKPGGKLAIFVPNLEILARAWLDKKISNFIFLVNVYGAYQGYEDDTHKWGYSESELLNRVSLLNEQTNEPKLKWSNIETITQSTLNQDIFKGHDAVLDWWILAKIFSK